MKKRLLVVVTLVLVAVLVLTLVACGGSTGQDADEPTPTPPNGQTPDDGDGDNEGEITPPENPGGEIAPPENPGGEIGEPEDPKDPDDGEVTDPDDGNEGEDPETPEQPAFVVDTVEKLLEYRSATLYDTLTQNFMNTMLRKCTFRDFTYNDATGINWYIAENTETALSKCGVTFYMERDGSFYFYSALMTFAEPVSVTYFVEGNMSQDIVDNAAYTRTYACNVSAADIEQNRPLAEAIITALGETFSPEDTILMAMTNPTTDPQWSWARICSVKQITGTAVNEYRLVVKAESATDEDGIKQLIENIETGKCKYGTVEKNGVMFETGVTADSVDKALPDATA